MSKPRSPMLHDSETLCGGGPIDWTALDPEAPAPTLPSLETPARRRRNQPVYERERSVAALPTTTCSACGARVASDVDRDTAWCPRCGTDLKPLITLALK